jgi:hypothetical protein
MGFNAPDLVTSLSTTQFRTELNSNFTLIETAFAELQNAIPTSRLSAQTNLDVIDQLVVPSGIIGIDSFVPSLSSDHTTFSISHDTYDSKSYCVIDQIFHSADASFNKTFESIGISGSGDYVVKFGVRTRGAPVLEQHLEIEDTDNLQDLTIWKMDVNRDVGAFTVTNLRFESTYLVSITNFTNAFAADIPLTAKYSGLLPAYAYVYDAGILIPWDCEVQKAFVRLGTMPAGHTDASDVVIQLSYGSGTDTYNVLADQATFTAATPPGTVRTLNATSAPYQLSAGSFVFPEIVTAEAARTDIPPTAADLSVVLIVKRIYHMVL